jgi:ketosteroid isomerase-like protein
VPARLLLLLGLLCAGAAQAAEPRLTEAAVRAFAAQQAAAWSAKDAPAFAATFSPDAVFVARARDSHGALTANGQSTRAQANVQARRFFARTRFTVKSTVDRVVLAPDGRSAEVFGHDATRVEAAGRPARAFCAETQQTVVLAHGRLLSKGETDTDIRCPR